MKNRNDTVPVSYTHLDVYKRQCKQFVRKCLKKILYSGKFLSKFCIEHLSADILMVFILLIFNLKYPYTRGT